VGHGHGSEWATLLGRGCSGVDMPLGEQGGEVANIPLAQMAGRSLGNLSTAQPSNQTATAILSKTIVRTSTSNPPPPTDMPQPQPARSRSNIAAETEEIVKRVKERKALLEVELNKVKLKLWETTVEQGGLYHLLDHYREKEKSEGGKGKERESAMAVDV